MPTNRSLEVPDDMTDEEWIAHCRSGVLLRHEEIAVVQRLADGMSHRRIAEELHIAQSTLNGRLKAARDRTDTRTIVELVAMSLRRGWID